MSTCNKKHASSLAANIMPQLVQVEVSGSIKNSHKAELTKVWPHNHKVHEKFVRNKLKRKRRRKSEQEKGKSKMRAAKNGNRQTSITKLA